MKLSIFALSAFCVNLSYVLPMLLFNSISHKCMVCFSVYSYVQLLWESWKFLGFWYLISNIVTHIGLLTGKYFDPCMCKKFVQKACTRVVLSSRSLYICMFFYRNLSFKVACDIRPPPPKCKCTSAISLSVAGILPAPWLCCLDTCILSI